ncbi:DUF2891 family protein [Streptomyces inhibens]|uniref:DUF2891 family protein n=1 Tax=Streptomyces inhibens TaxID=2293571 RepID=UPI003CC8388E
MVRAYPYAPMHLLTGPQDLVPPRTHHPAFHGSYDWHSSVHMHWLLVRLLRRCPGRVPGPPRHPHEQRVRARSGPGHGSRGRPPGAGRSGHRDTPAPVRRRP